MLHSNIIKIMPRATGLIGYIEHRSPKKDETGKYLIHPVAGAGKRSRAGQPVEVLLVQLVVIDDGKFYYLSLSISLLVEREIICVVIS